MTRLVAICLLISTVARADDTGTLTGQFAYDGEPPRSEPLTLNKDQEFCGPFGLVSEELLVDPKTLGVANVVLWLDVKASGRVPALPPQAEEAKPARMDNAKCRFAPHVAVVRAGDTLLMGNKDPIAHAMLFFAFANDPVSLTVAANAKGDESHVFAKPEPLPVKVTCPIHAWMLGYVVVQDHPFVAVTDHEGKFQIDGLPPGEWTFRVWQEKCGYVKNVSRDGEEQPWDRGLVKLTVKAGQNALGTVKLSPKLFAE